MPEYRVSKAAQQDIRDIGRYTQETWGAAQRRKYLTELEEKFRQLAENPGLAPERAEFQPPVRIHHHTRHLIIYIPDDAGILIVRVLHDAMDVTAHLPE